MGRAYGATHTDYLKNLSPYLYNNEMRPYKATFLLALFVLALLVSIDWHYNFSAWWYLVYTLLLFGIFYAGVTKIQWNFFLHSYNQAPTKQKLLALSFDDGIQPYTATILDQLKKENVPAAFFVIGKNLKGQEQLLQRLHHEGHIVGNHSQEHGFHFDWKSATGMMQEIKVCNDTIHHIIGQRPKLIRPPYGITNPNVAKAIAQCGMHSIGWTVRSWDTQIKNEQKLLNRLTRTLQPGAVILLHDSQKVTAQILTSFINVARKQGYTFVRLDKLLQLQAYE